MKLRLQQLSRVGEDQDVEIDSSHDARSHIATWLAVKRCCVATELDWRRNVRSQVQKKLIDRPPDTGAPTPGEGATDAPGWMTGSVRQPIVASSFSRGGARRIKNLRHNAANVVEFDQIRGAERVACPIAGRVADDE